MLIKNNSRKKNTIYNFISSIGGQFITIIMQFVVRTVFVSTLGKSYLGISGLFSNILSMLSLAEFGVGSAILFKLYEPIAKEDTQRIAILMSFYKKVYRGIGIVIAIIGVCFIPFLPKFISDYDKLVDLNINIVFVFILYLLNTTSSYLFWAYKSAIIRASQKEYLINLTSYIFTIGLGIVQITCLVLFHNFELYVLLQVISIVVQNIVYARIADKMYPYINRKVEETLDKKEVGGIIKDCSALFLYRLNGVVLKATDNIIISTFLGIEMVGMYSNYYIFYTTIDTLFGKVFSSVAHSLGNLHTSNDIKHEYKIYEIICLITAILGGTAGVGIAVVSNDFVHAWLGTEWLLSQPFAILMGLEIFTLSFRQMLSKYRTSMGLFQQAKYRPLAGMIINLVISIILVKNWGICGVLVGTIVADWLTMMWFDPFVIHKYGFKNEYSVLRYYKKFLKYFLITLIMGMVNLSLCNYFSFGIGWLNVIIHICICAISVPAIFIVININKAEGQYLYHFVQSNVEKIIKKIMSR